VKRSDETLDGGDCCGGGERLLGCDAKRVAESKQQNWIQVQSRWQLLLPFQRRARLSTFELETRIRDQER
jgi:hypothetical protein